MNNQTNGLEELDLAIPDMHTTADEAQVGGVLNGLPGVGSVRLVSRGALVHYRPQGISHAQICDALHKAGFRATTFQDSATGETGATSA
jgi:copper chaperone CopZ